MSAIVRTLLVTRQSSPNTSATSSSISDRSKYGLIVAASFFALFVALFVIHGTLKSMRLAGRKPTLLPGSYLKNKWNNWRPSGVYVEVSRTNLDDGHPYDPGALEELRPTATRGSATSTVPNLPTEQSGGGILGRMSTLRRAMTRASGVERNTSIRSVMTLPRYSQTPAEHEEVLGREGERDGIDEIVVFPETADEELERYNDEAEELYQIRVARRRENAERRDRQQARRAAREAGDWDTLRELQAEARRRSETVSSDPASAAALIANRQKSRERRVSAVSYASLGVAHHDGSRVRRTSGESERPLMDSASGISAGRSSRATSLSSQLTLPIQQPAEDTITESPVTMDNPGPGLQRTGTLPPTYSEQPATGHTSTSSLSSPVRTPTAEQPTPPYAPPQTGISPPVAGVAQQQGFFDAQGQPAAPQSGAAVRSASQSQSPPIVSPTTPVIRINDGQLQYPPPNPDQQQR